MTGTVEPAGGQPPDPGLLGAGHGLGRGAEGRPAARLDLAEHERAPAPGDQVDLPVPAAPVAPDDLVAVLLVPRRRELLAGGPEGAARLDTGGGNGPVGGTAGPDG